MKINIFYQIQDSAFGGGNQFLKVLKKEFLSLGVYEESAEKADVILFDSYQNLKELVWFKYKNPNKVFIHRLGPVFHTYRGKHWKMVDFLMASVANKVADVVIVQSEWAYKDFLKLGLDGQKRIFVIHNSVDKEIFNTNKRTAEGSSLRKIKLVADSWSSNWNKGFKFYEYLDKNLDFEKYSMTFVGNSPIKFKNIKHISPLGSVNLSKELQKHDIFISGVKDDACSNSIVEALACGLPVVALDSGGNGELIGSAGELFFDEDDLIKKIEKASNFLHKYEDLIKIDSIRSVAEKYIEAISGVVCRGRITFLFLAKILIAVSAFKIFNKVYSFFYVKQ